MSTENIVAALIKSIPYPEQIKDLDFTKVHCVFFTWRGARYRVTETLHVDEEQGGVLIGNDKAILMQALLQRGAA